MKWVKGVKIEETNGKAVVYSLATTVGGICHTRESREKINLESPRHKKKNPTAVCGDGC